MQLLRIKSRPLSLAWRYAIVLGFVSVALTLSLLLQEPFENPSWFFFPAAVLGATWVAGTGPGWLAVVLCTLAAQYFFIPPFYSWGLRTQDIPFFLAFVGCEVAANRLVAWRNRVEETLRQARDQLEIRVAERTAELETANNALQDQMLEQKRTEEKLQAARSDLARIFRITTVGELAASIAHEVNQPLAAVVANSDACIAWLGHEPPEIVEARLAADRAVEGATRASDVIARIRSLISKGAPERVPVALNAVINETVALIKSQAGRNDVSIVTALDPELPAVAGDRVQLQQVVLNLMLNAIEAMTSIHDRERRLTITSAVTSDGQVQISIQDTGIGLNQETISRLFEPFFTTRAQGIGMGLSISRSIIEVHCGKLWVESVMNQGSTFHFTLPTGDC